MSPEEARVIRDAAVRVVEREAAGTRRLIAAIPADRLDWRPDPKGTAALELAWHIVESEILLCEVFERGSFQGLAHSEHPPPTIAEVLAHHEQMLPPGLERLRALSPERLAEEVRLFGRTCPLAEHLWFMPHHSIHHRGQLSAYLRAMGAFVPGVYGRSADERSPRP